ncbi:MAG: DUF4959 domain-containing protein [Prevotellaceae bacterium]|jgi:hypothetical protein|nr:DUF4959 domain-containing protein [Prevotellaceae bacterium]
MKKEYVKYLTIFLITVLVASCKEGTRYETTSGDKTPPGKITNVTYKPLYGGVRFFYTIPRDEDLLSVDAEYTNAKNQTFSFSASYYADSLDVYGFGDTIAYSVKLNAIDRAGNRSETLVMQVKPLESAISRVAKSVVVKPGFSSFFLDWVNELEQSINIYVDFNFVQNGTAREITSVFSSNFLTDRRFIEDLALSPQDVVTVKVKVEDRYGNLVTLTNEWKINLYEDSKIPKDKWVLPQPNDTIVGVPQFYGNGYEGRMAYLIDDIIDRNDNRNFTHTAGRGRTGVSADGNLPWNAIIDLGDYYELSRIVTNQRHDRANDVEQGQFYRSENAGIYNMYFLDEDTGEWELISQHKIPVPVGKSELDIVKIARAGDMAYMYPDDPKYTKAARWFRYEALKCFDDNYNSTSANCLSEITLFGRKANR